MKITITVEPCDLDALNVNLKEDPCLRCQEADHSSWGGPKCSRTCAKYSKYEECCEALKRCPELATIKEKVDSIKELKEKIRNLNATLDAANKMLKSQFNLVIDDNGIVSLATPR